jgi:hypothetical protein
MHLHVPFEYLKHKLWLKERSRVKVPIWFPTIKSLKSPWFTCVQVACHISLENFWWRLQFFFRPHLNWRSTQKVMGFQNHMNPNFENFGTSNLKVPRQNDIWVQAPWSCIENTIGGKVVASFKSKPWWILWVYALKVLQPRTNQLVVWFV